MRVLLRSGKRDSQPLFEMKVLASGATHTFQPHDGAQSGDACTHIWSTGGRLPNVLTPALAPFGQSSSIAKVGWRERDVE